jgi:hypothetical protein
MKKEEYAVDAVLFVMLSENVVESASQITSLNPRVHHHSCCVPSSLRELPPTPLVHDLHH